jgi:hypothetical protein
MSEPAAAYGAAPVHHEHRTARQRARFWLRALGRHLEAIANSIDPDGSDPLPVAVVVVADGTGSAADVRVRTHGCDLAQAVGLLDIAKMELYTAGSTPPSAEDTD